MSKNRNLANLIASSNNPIADIVASAPAALDTLNELASALGNDASFATTVTNSLATKVSKDSSTGAANLPAGTTAQRPATPVAGMTRYNTTINAVETYHNNSWIALSNTLIATGGVISQYTSNNITYQVHSFLSSGTFAVSSNASVIDYLIVAGGGGGGTDGDVGGGGGAGGYISGSISVTTQNYSIIVGAGGAGGTSSYTPGTGSGGNGSQGGNSSAFGLTAIGGGYGGTRGQAGGSGGSGGGGGDNGGGGGAGTSGQGYAGGTAPAINSNGGWDQGGGGGAGGAASSYNPGPGITNSISGSAVTYAAGGRGMGPSTAAANTGNGGRGSATSADSTGGSGIVIIRYAIQ